jgi:hypothetical protein
VIRRADGDRIVVGADGRRPGFALDDAPPWQVVAPVVDWARETLGVEVAVLRRLRPDGGDAVDGAGLRRYEAEWLSGVLPAGWREAPTADLPAAVGSVLEEPVGAHQPWYRPGWFAEMVAWIDGRLVDAGIARHGPVRQVRSWGRSALLELDTDRGRLWVKDVPAVFAHEVQVTALLTDLDPGLVPALVAADAMLGRLLMEHVDGPALPTLRDQPLAWTATMSRVAEAQRVLAADPAALAMAGVARSDPADLATSVAALLADDDLLGIGRAGGLTADEAVAVRARIPELADAADRLARDGIPPSLDHGDFVAGQVILGEMGPVILDWSDATITHPFLTAASFLGDVEDVPGGLGPDLAAAYLGPWGDRADPASLGAALDLARLVHPVHMASLYATRILPGLDQPWEMADRVAADLRPLTRSAPTAR